MRLCAANALLTPFSCGEADATVRTKTLSRNSGTGSAG
jgi:hypothetical protein